MKGFIEVVGQDNCRGQQTIAVDIIEHISRQDRAEPPNYHPGTWIHIKGKFSAMLVQETYDEVRQLIEAAQ